MTLKRTGGLLPVLLAAALLAGCGGSPEQNPAADSTALEKPKVKLETVKVRPVAQTYDFTATVEANVTNNIAPSMAVRIDKIFVEVGDPVRAGQKLVQMDQTSVIQQQVQLDNYKIEFGRVDELFKVGGASKSEWDAKKTALDVAQTAFDNLIANTTLTSPITGIVTARNYDNGDMFNLGGQPVVVVEQITPVKLMINVSESLFKEVKKGMDVSLKLDVYGDEVFHGKVSLVYPTIDPTTRTFPVEITIPNGDRRVRPGMFARVTMSFGTTDRVVAPDRSIIKQAGSGDRYIYVYKDGKVSYNKVETGRRMGDEYEIVSGVEDGDRVVVTGQNRLNNGMEVDIDTTK